jgi:AmmeMemoRadiSam system protein B
MPGVVSSDAPHAAEHSLEVQLPFLQRVLDAFVLVPIAVGDADPDAVARVIDAAWGGSETLVLISSDLSHYLPYDTARTLDRTTVDAIASLTLAPIDHEHACGATPVNGMIRAARAHGLRATVLDLRNSGDTAGSRDGVVGYGAIAFHA